MRMKQHIVIIASFGEGTEKNQCGSAVRGKSFRPSGTQHKVATGLICWAIYAPIYTLQLRSRFCTAMSEQCLKGNCFFFDDSNQAYFSAWSVLCPVYSWNVFKLVLKSTYIQHFSLSKSWIENDMQVAIV